MQIYIVNLKSSVNMDNNIINITMMRSRQILSLINKNNSPSVGNTISHKGITHRNVYFKAKPPKQEQPGGKSKPSAQAPPALIQQPSEIDGLMYLRPRQASLSDKQREILNSGFEDISVADKQMLDKLAEEIIRLKSSTMYKLVQEGGLGTEDALYLNQRELEDKQLKEAIISLRKQRSTTP